MDIGMLWFDNNTKVELPVRIQKAAAYYQKKYGRKPTLCFVHPSMLSDPLDKSAGIEVKPHQMVLPNHLWLGIGEATTAGR
ncbi:MAG: hypothetical protein K8R77_05945 [Anaerolineaceae bacterium]|nr:hypothetical protein [Anaerolineaceae bacterium]